MKVLIVVDMQNDFINGSLGSEMAQAIVPKVISKIKEFDGKIIYTRDTHFENYLNTQEGKHLPVKHCIKGTDGWQINEDVYAAGNGKIKEVLDKPTFGYLLWEYLLEEPGDYLESVELCGLCTDICVVSNALILKALVSETPVIVHSECCAGVTKESHDAALLTMKMCQVEVK